MSLATMEPQQLDFTILSPGDREWGVVTDQGITFAPSTSYAQWEEVTKTAAALYEGSYRTHTRAMFLLGDALDFGEQAFGEQSAQAIDQTRAVMRLAGKTLQNASWIARSIPPQNRKLDTLSFAHHEVVAKLEPEEQAKFLNLAEAEGLTQADLKKQVKAAHPSPKNGKPSNSPVAGNEEVTEADALKACETVLIHFAGALRDKKPDKLTDEQRAAFSVPMAELYKLARKFVRKENW